ncbi:ribosome biogenesis/translation initiation ATPase RLI (plasmid) [Natrinema zhouii]|uniref:ribosome biogenesis/translation initiation ATPase RLI n=1 Tax=Natrinema zhouii TaxID=1710539 RepID=UPI001CFFACD4|nr:ribosome biogenesis/translation initiation ATPase RLI [Natrinema zhouii]UHQ97995.1 ribosome biogenesis/translation initiation ATPase RLI [Natrinema zhouii]
MPPSSDSQTDYIAIIDQDEVIDEVRDIAVKYDPLNRSGREGFHVTDDGELHIDDALVMNEHKLIEKKIPNDAIEIVPLPSATGQLVHQYGENGFRLYELPAPEDGSIVGLLGRNGIGKSTALQLIAGKLRPNFGDSSEIAGWDDAIQAFRGTVLQQHLERLRNDEVTAAYKPQRVDLPSSIEDETVRERLAAQENRTEDIVATLQLDAILDRPITALSGGERQRVAIAETLATNADLYLFDEPSSFLDIEQRLTAARTIRNHVETTDTAAIVVEHDLATLDLLSDSIHVLYGEPGGFGVVSQRLSTRDGINQFLKGRLTEDNVQIRPNAIKFPTGSDRSASGENVILEYPALKKQFDEFTLTVEPGRIHKHEVLGICGQNGLGKTTFARLIAGGLESDEGSVPDNVTVSYKPQYMSPDDSGTVRDRFAMVTDVHSRAFQSRIRDPFDLEPLFDQALEDLSGGELQRVSIALCLARDADCYLLDEPSVFLDVDRRVSVASQIRRFATRTDHPVLVVDHDMFLIDRIADRLLVFDGVSGKHGHASSPQSLRDGMNEFLSSIEITFRRDERTGRPRVNDPGSQLDKKGKESGEYYYTDH